MAATFEIKARVVQVTGYDKVTRVRVADNIRRRQNDGSWVDARTNFFTLVLFDEALRDYAANTLRPGDLISASGVLNTSEYEPEWSQKPITSIDLSCTFLAAVPKRTADKINGAPAEDTMPDDGYSENFAPF